MQITLKYEVLKNPSPNNELCLIELQPVEASWVASLNREWTGEPENGRTNLTAGEHNR